MYMFGNDEVERILSCKWSVLCNILEYSYIVQIAKRRTSHVFAFNMQNTGILPDLEFACWKQTHDLCVPLLFVQYIYIQICNTNHTEYICKT